MTQQEILDGNRLIAMFMSDEPEVLEMDLRRAGTLEGMQYHSEWDWLMPVLDKLDKDERNPQLCVGYDYTIKLYTARLSSRNIVSVERGDTRIEAVYSAILAYLAY